jgi:hypothetical protein
VAERDNERQQDSLNEDGRRREHLVPPVPPQYMRDAEQRWPAGHTGVGHRKDRLKVAVQIARGNRSPAELQQVLPGIPPRMHFAGGKDAGAAGRHGERLASHSRAERAGLHGAFFELMKMDVRRRALRVRRQRAVESENHLPAGVAHAAHPQNLSGVFSHQRKTVIHGRS